MNQIFARIESILTGSEGYQWLQLLFGLNDGQAHQLDDGLAAELVALGICCRRPSGLFLTSFGRKCADSAREYLFWIQRQRRFHGEDQHQCCNLENFRGKDILELGPGWGCNLIRLATVARCAVGVEIDPIYIEFGRILAKREGMMPPKIILGRGENTPLRAETFDWVLIWSALQYMNIDDVFKECGRVLRPGGYVLATAPLLYHSIFSGLQQVTCTCSARPLVATTLMIVNTMWYQVFHTRLRKNIKGNETARPVLVTKRYLTAACQTAGLRFRSDLSLSLADRLLLVLQKSATNA